MNKIWAVIPLGMLGCSAPSSNTVESTVASDSSSEKPIYSAEVESVTMGIEPDVEVRPEGRNALPFPPGVDPLTVCGPVDELEHVEFFEGQIGENNNYANDYQASTVLIQWRTSVEIRDLLGPGSHAGNVGDVRWCSGTLIGDNKILTAAHCFPNQSNDWILPSKNNQNTSAAINATLMKVVFNYQLANETGATRVVETYAIEELLEHWKGGLDFAVLELGDQLESSPGYELEPAQVSTRLVAVDEVLAIIQHPRGQRKKIHSGEAKSLVGSLIHYSNIDTHGGSSGSGVRDKDGVVIGVHIRGGCGVSDGTNKGVANSAIAIHSAYL